MCCDKVCVVPVSIHGVHTVMRISVVPGSSLLLFGNDKFNFLAALCELKNTLRMFQRVGDRSGRVLNESCAGHLLVPNCPA